MNNPSLRKVPDRFRQIALFELIGLLAITPLFTWVSHTPLLESGTLLAVLSLLAALWNGVYCTGFDWLEGLHCSRSSDQRPTNLRIVHAVGFEGGLMLLTLPIIVWWTNMSWLTAWLADLGLALVYTGYAYLFNLAYDRLFPLAKNP